MQITRKPTLAAAGVLLVGGLAAALTACSTPGADIGAASATSAQHSTAERTATAADARTDGTDGTEVLASVTVGDAVFVLGRNGDDIRSAASFDGSDLRDSWQTFGPAQDVAPDGLTVVNPSNHTDDHLASVEGQVGSDVTALDVTTRSGTVAHAEVANGYYIAAWAGDDFTTDDDSAVQFVLHLADGSTKTVPYADTAED